MAQTISGTLSIGRGARSEEQGADASPLGRKSGISSTTDNITRRDCILDGNVCHV